MRLFTILILLLMPLTGIVTGAENITITPLANPSILLARPVPADANRREIGFDILPLADGGLISGSTAPAPEGPPDGLLVRITNEGDVVWRKSYGGSGMDLLFSCLPDTTNGFVCAGFKSPSGKVDMKAMDGWILRIDQQGEITWEHTYGGPGEDRITGIRQTTDGWMAVGHQETNDMGIQSWVLRIDGNGKELNSWTSKNSIPEKGLDVLPLQDGGFILAGGFGADRESSEGFVARIAADGSRAWSRELDGPGFQVGYHLQPFSDGSILLIGYGFVDASRNQDVHAMRISADGAVRYHKIFGGPTNDRATNAIILENDTIVFVGQTQRPGAPNEDIAWDSIIYTLDQNGTPVWSGRFGGEGVEFGRAVKGKADNLWIIGHTTSGRPGSNATLIRMDVSGLPGLKK